MTSYQEETLINKPNINLLKVMQKNISGVKCEHYNEFTCITRTTIEWTHKKNYILK